jgi:hypothetical protein
MSFSPIFALCLCHFGPDFWWQLLMTLSDVDQVFPIHSLLMDTTSENPGCHIFELVMSRMSSAMS